MVSVGIDASARCVEEDVKYMMQIVNMDHVANHVDRREVLEQEAG